MTILKDAPEGAKVLDLGAERAARAEARAAAGEGVPYLKLAAGFVEVKAEIDILSADDFLAGDMRAGLAKMLGDPADIEAVLAGGISQQDFEAVMVFVTGKSLGELSASPVPSLRTGTNSRPTSRATTPRISDKPVGARPRGAADAS